MKYLILIYSNPRARAQWAAMSAEEQGAGLAAYSALNESLVASGELVAAEALAMTAIPVPPRSDGPFAEAKEQLGGFYLVDVASEERAREIGAMVPEAPLGHVEIRPAQGLGDFAR